jgi:hypothetical protein
MQANNLLAMTTQNQVLSSLCMFCRSTALECPVESDTMIAVSIPINRPLPCGLDKLRFFNPEVQAGFTKWLETDKPITPKIINGVQYLTVWLQDPCKCYNFDYHLEPPCFNPTKMKLQFKKVTVKRIEAIIDSANTVYVPTKLSENTYELTLTDSTQTKLYLDLEVVDSRGSLHKLKRVPLEKVRLRSNENLFQIRRKDLKKYDKLFKLEIG